MKFIEKILNYWRPKSKRLLVRTVLLYVIGFAASCIGLWSERSEVIPIINTIEGFSVLKYVRILWSSYSILFLTIYVSVLIMCTVFNVFLFPPKECKTHAKNE